MLDGKETKLPYRDLAWMREYTEKYASDPTCYDVNQEQDGFFHNVKFLVDRFATEQSEDAITAALHDLSAAMSLIREGNVDRALEYARSAYDGVNKLRAVQALDAPRVKHASDLPGVFYVYLKGDIAPGGAKTTKRVMVNVDYDEAGEPIGIEYGV